MTALAVSVLGAEPSPQAAAPGITFRLRLESLGGDRMHAIVLRCQTRIEPRGRRYTGDEQARLFELFGDVSLLVQSGDRVGIVGPNGAGKTTLLRVLLGELPPRRGTSFSARRPRRTARITRTASSTRTRRSLSK